MMVVCDMFPRAMTRTFVRVGIMIVTSSATSVRYTFACSARESRCVLLAGFCAPTAASS